MRDCGSVLKLYMAALMDCCCAHAQTSENRATQVKLQIPGGSAESRLLAAEAISTDRFLSCSFSSAAAGVATTADLDVASSTGHSADTLDLSHDLILSPVTSSQESDVSGVVDVIKQEPGSAGASVELTYNAADPAASLLAASADPGGGGFALVQTETGQFLLARGNMHDGYHVLGQAESPFTSMLNIGGAAAVQANPETDAVPLNLVQQVPTTAQMSDAVSDSVPSPPLQLMAPTVPSGSVFTQFGTLRAIDTSNDTATDYTTTTSLSQAASATAACDTNAFDVHL